MLIKTIEPLLRGQLRYMFSGFSKVNLNQHHEKIEDVFDVNDPLQIQKKAKLQQVINRENLQDLIDVKRDEKYAHYANLEINFATEIYGHKCILASMKDFTFSPLPLIAGGGIALSACSSFFYMISYPSFFAHATGLLLAYFFQSSQWGLRRCPQIKAIYQSTTTKKLTIHYTLNGNVGGKYSSILDKVGGEQITSAILKSAEPIGVKSVQFEHKTEAARQEIREPKVSGKNGVFEVDKKDFIYGVRLGNSYDLWVKKFTDVIWCRVNGELFWIEVDGLETNSRLFSELLK